MPAGIDQGSMFNPAVPLPLDLRYVVTSIADLDTGHTHDGMFRYVVDTNEVYHKRGNLEGWVRVDDTTYEASRSYAMGTLVVIPAAADNTEAAAAEYPEEAEARVDVPYLATTPRLFFALANIATDEHPLLSTNWALVGGAGMESTDDLPEGVTNRYFTEERVLSTPLTGVDEGSGGPVTAEDTVLTGFSKLNNAIAAQSVKHTIVMGETSNELLDFMTIVNRTVQAPSFRAVRVASIHYRINGGSWLSAYPFVQSSTDIVDFKVNYQSGYNTCTFVVVTTNI